MEREIIEAKILNLCACILLGKAKEDEIKKVISFAKDNNCLDIVRREFASIQQIFEAKKVD